MVPKKPKQKTGIPPLHPLETGDWITKPDWENEESLASHLTLRENIQIEVKRDGSWQFINEA